MSEPTKLSNGTILRRIWELASNHKALTYATIVVSILVSVFQTLRPTLFQTTVDDSIVGNQPQKLLWMILLIGCILILEIVTQFFLEMNANRLSQTIVADLRNKLFAHFMRFNMKHFDKTPLGVIVTRSVNDIETIAQIFTDGLMLVFGDSLRIIAILAVMFSMNHELTFLVMLVFPIMVGVTWWFQRALKSTFQQERTQVARMNTFVQERLSGMGIVQAFHQEKREYDRFVNINQDLNQANIKTVFYFSVFFPVVEILSSLALGLIIWYGGLKAYAGSGFTIGQVFSFIMYINLLFRPMRQIAEKFNQMQRGFVGADRVMAILDNHEPIQHNGKLQAESLRGDIVFENVTFSYVSGEPVIRNLSFELKAGQSLALVGATGSGKSTIVNLLNRFYDIEQGRILLDGVDVRNYDMHSLRCCMVQVQQDVFLFADSILNNITLRQPIPLEQVQAAAQAIGLNDFIEKLPNGYHFDVKERGGTLSVGQRQLIAFLRAYVAQPDVLILDEATSSIDSETEALIQQATEKIIQNRTSIIIAHRLSTIQHADKILVMQQGQAVESGTHTELLEKNGAYKTLYEAQFRGE